MQHDLGLRISGIPFLMFMQHVECAPRPTIRASSLLLMLRVQGVRFREPRSQNPEKDSYKLKLSAEKMGGNGGGGGIGDFFE